MTDKSRETLGFFYWFWNVNLRNLDDRIGFVVISNILLMAASVIVDAAQHQIFWMKIYISALGLSMAAWAGYSLYSYLRSIHAKYQDWRTRQLEQTMKRLGARYDR